MAKDVSIEIGFTGGGSTAVAVPEEQLEAFTKAVTEGQRDQWFNVTSADGGEFFVDLSTVIFVRVGSRNRSLGFSHA